MSHPFTESEFARFTQRFNALSGYDLRHYKDAPQRVNQYLERMQYPSLAHLLHVLENQPSEIPRFWESQTVKVSSFFRNPERFQELKQKILPNLIKERPQLKIWSAGCAMGAEPYSLVLLLANMKHLPQQPILASDIDPEALNQGRNACFSPDLLQNVARSDLSYYFEPRLDDDRTRYRIKSPWREAVRFRQHDLLTQAYPQGFDLIVCRNVMIYFNKASQYEIYRKLHHSLRENGVLFVGGAEQLLDIQSLGYRVLSPYFLQKCGTHA